MTTHPTPHPTPDPSEQHLDLDQLADALADDRAHEAHLTGCAPCRAALARLEQAMPAVTAALASAQVPPEPADLPQRLARVTADAPVTSLAARRSRRWPMVAGGAAAAAVLVVGGLALGTSVFDSRSPDRGQTEAAGTAGGTTKTNSTGFPYRKDGKLLARELPALLAGTAPVAATPLSAALQPDSAQKSERYAGAVPAPVDPLAGLRTTTGLASCLAELDDPDDPQQPLALDYATWDGQPALVVVLPTSKAGKVDVLVVGAGCRSGNDALLYYARLPRS